MSYRSRRLYPRPERFTHDGAVIVTPNQLALLQGLMDRPDCRASSRTDWVRAGMPYLRRFREPSYWCFSACSIRLPATWVSRTRAGRCIACQLTPRGRDILDRRVPVHVQGIGPYQGWHRLPKRSR